MAGRTRSLLSSPRRRRRFLLLLTVFALAGIVALLIAYDRNSAKSIATPATKGKPLVPAPPPRSVKFTRREAKVVLPIAERFVRDAVARKDMHAAWNITAPALKVDTSRSDWDRGENTEIVPFPLDYARWRLDYSYRNTVGLEVAIFPLKHASVKNPMVFYMELQKTGQGGHGSWLVDQWQPAPGSAQVVQGALNPLAADRSTPPPQRLGSVWLLGPIGVLGLIVLIPVALGLREWLRGRRARRNYESGLPTLSDYGPSR
jgi:hypothetical protein